MPDTPALDHAAVFAGAVVCAMAGTVCSGLLLAPRLLWPERVTPPPDPPEIRADWAWPSLLAVPPLVILFQTVAWPLRWAGVPRTPWMAFGVAMGSGVAAVAVAWALLCRRTGKPAAALGLRWPHWKPHLLLMPLVGYPLGLSLMLLAILFEVGVLKRPLPSPQAALQLMRSLQDPALRAFAVVAVAVVAPVAEEILFRGVLFRGLRLRWGLLPAMLASAALFSAAHLDPGHALPLFALGMLLAFTVEETGSVWPGIVLHAMVNGIATLLAWKMPAAG